MPINMPSPHGDKSLKCQKCQWFHKGFDGKTCRQKREVLADTQACVEFKPFQGTPYDILAQDKFLLDLQMSLKVFTDVKLKAYNDELTSYRMSSGGKADKMELATEEGMMNLAHKFEVCQAYTDRVVEIKASLYEKDAEIQSFAKDAQAYLFANYTEQTRGLKNEVERQAFYRNSLPWLYKALEKLDITIKKADLIHSNLKDCHFSMSQTQNGAIEVWKSKVQSLVSGQRSKGVG